MPLHIRLSTPEDDARIVQILNAIHPDRPPQTVEHRRHYQEAAGPEAAPKTLVAERSSQIVGTAMWNKRIFSTEPDVYWFHVDVDPRLWGQGTGTALYDSALEELKARGARKLITIVREDHPRAQEFAEKRGFTRTGFGERASRLEVAKANLERSREAERSLQGSTIRIATLAELGTDEPLLRAICELDNESTRDIPSSTDWTYLPFEKWKKYAMEGPGQSPETFWVAMDAERPVGLAILSTHQGGMADNEYTGVARDYRGRGIARALKLKTVEWAAENGIRYIATGNDTNNKPMLAINIEMGYQPLPANIEMVKEL